MREPRVERARGDIRLSFQCDGEHAFAARREMRAQFGGNPASAACGSREGLASMIEALPTDLTASGIANLRHAARTLRSL